MGWQGESCPGLPVGGHSNRSTLAVDLMEATKHGQSRMVSILVKHCCVNIFQRAADATSHLFFAYLRSLSPDSVRGINGISNLPLSLQALVKDTKYPPEQHSSEPISKVVMVVDSVSPTPFALLRRARRFEYREDDRILNRFSDYEDPVDSLTDECKRVLKSISSANQSDSATTKASTSLGDSSWSRFEDVGFGGLGGFNEEEEDDLALGKKRLPPQGLRSVLSTKHNDLGRPTTPSWADFLSSGFADEPSSPGPRPLLLPPDKVLPPIELDSKRSKSSQSNHHTTNESSLEPGELASINAMNLDDAFWWVWITSLAGEETLARKAAFGRCALIETAISGRSWLVIEEMVKGAAPEPEVGAYVAEKKSRFTFGKRSKVSKTKATGRHVPPPTKMEPMMQNSPSTVTSRTNIGPDQHARIQAAAAALQHKQKQHDGEETTKTSPRRARQGDAMSTKTNSVFTLQPVIMSEAAPAMKWANTYDKKAVRAAYLGNNFAGRGSRTDLGTTGSLTPQPPAKSPVPKEKSTSDYGFPKTDDRKGGDRDLPALPPPTPGEKIEAPIEPPPPVPSGTILQDPPLPPQPVGKPPQPPNASNEYTGEPLEQTQTVTQNGSNGRSGDVDADGKTSPKKLKKQPGTGGLRGIFGNKKDRPAPANMQAPDSSAVAAARAAYTGPRTRVNHADTKSLGRRLSGIGRKKTPPATAIAADPIKDADEPLPAPPAPFKEGTYDSQTSLSRVDTNERKGAEQEFQIFDQHGPLDQPAFVPEDSPRRSVVPETDVSRPSTSDQPRGPHFEPPIGRGQYEPSMSSEEVQSEHEDENGGAYSPAKNRWSQIRRNAAERAGRASEDPKNATRPQEQTQNHEDEEDESGAEESNGEESES